MSNVTKIAMSTRSKLIVAAAIAVLGLASPASAQSYNRTEGSGNSRRCPMIAKAASIAAG